jgi:hypothetical protein
MYAWRKFSGVYFYDPLDVRFADPHRTPKFTTNTVQASMAAQALKWRRKTLG